MDPLRNRGDRFRMVPHRRGKGFRAAGLSREDPPRLRPLAEEVVPDRVHLRPAAVRLRCAVRRRVLLADRLERSLDDEVINDVPPRAVAPEPPAPDVLRRLLALSRSLLLLRLVLSAPPLLSHPLLLLLRRLRLRLRLLRLSRAVLREDKRLLLLPLRPRLLFARVLLCGPVAAFLRLPCLLPPLLLLLLLYLGVC